ncbi:enoyl-CoA hydratase/isomerase family protein [Blastococcus sp. TML/M2B]|uniref:enoyl-CoA hydratase/isomerase family protein n=1 Tax=unclassified Blastococcus TaxID=2619396 RepID=UPI00190AFC04|nr:MULTISPECIES: enoyl-CoA hydratase-related protein [unclassified Blastococcus]MBN1092199.1 enoyl-CoA hydratase/isomerase family protein [Blastococcus sp. TML/M2B]MBN1097700.1 enoyl-CoA hydratase/isomerase family protein [Blastococcus sp. TML/C7B]
MTPVTAGPDVRAVGDDAQPVRMSRAGDVVTLTLANPQRKNAMSHEAWLLLRDSLVEVGSGDARVLVVTGAGDDFCAGADLSAVRGGRPPMANMAEVNQACLALHRLPIPTIARVDGVAVGAGMNLALGCDFVIASTRARFSEIFAKRGLSVDFGGSWLLPRLIGLHRAKELVLLGDMLGAEEAHRWGLVREVVEPDGLDAAVDALAGRLLAGPPIAMRQSKRMLNDSFEVGLERALEDEARSQEINFATDDVLEAGRAFRDKRAPVFRGR